MFSKKAFCSLAFLIPFASLSEDKISFENNWQFLSSYQQVTNNWIVVNIYEKDNKWEIKDILPLSNYEIDRESTIEPFIVSPDFQIWTNYFRNNIANCDSFAVQNSDTKNICFSKFSTKNNSKAFIGLFFGGNGIAGHSYDTEMVNQAIRSIHPDKAIKALENYEAKTK